MRPVPLSATFADPTRRAILDRLAAGDPFQMSLPAVSQNLKELEPAGLVRKGPQGPMAAMPPGGGRCATGASGRRPRPARQVPAATAAGR